MWLRALVGSLALAGVFVLLAVGVGFLPIPLGWKVAIWIALFIFNSVAKPVLERATGKDVTMWLQIMLLHHVNRLKIDYCEVRASYTCRSSSIDHVKFVLQGAFGAQFNFTGNAATALTSIDGERVEIEARVGSPSDEGGDEDDQVRAVLLSLRRPNPKAKELPDRLQWLDSLLTSKEPTLARQGGMRPAGRRASLPVAGWEKPTSAIKTALQAFRKAGRETQYDFYPDAVAATGALSRRAFTDMKNAALLFAKRA